jgi:hypothetical protein
MPVYTSIIEMNNSNHVVIGTEYGIYATDNIAAASVIWAPEDNGMGRVPVYSLRQQLNNLPYMEVVSVIEGETVVDVYPGTNNFGAIYAGTHGRGSFVSKKYLSIERSSITNSVFRPSLHIYPNPVSDIATIKFTIGNQSEATVNIYDINGRLVIANRAGRFAAGTHTLPIDVSSLKMGVYIVQLVSGGQSVSARMVVK